MTTFVSPLNTDLATHERVIGITAAWLHGESSISTEMLPSSREELVSLVLALGLLNAALLKLWGWEIDVEPETLLQDIAFGRLT